MKFSLEPYHGRGSRYRCPKCGREFCLARYINTETGLQVAPHVGRCNHEDSCGYHYKPAQFFAEQSKAIVCEIEPSRPQSNYFDLIPCSYVTHYKSPNSNFVCWLSTLFPEERILKMTSERLLGAINDRKVIFWQIDIKGNVRTGKVMQYDIATGHNTHIFNWMHCIVGRKNFVLRQCLDGEHLLARYPDKPVMLVESYKNACLVQCVTNYYVVVSTDCKGGFNADRCRALKGRRIVVMPDCGAYADWWRKARQIATEVGCTMQVFDFLERRTPLTAEQRASGYDIGDYIVDQIKDGEPLEELERRLIELDTMMHPRVEALINSLIKRI